MAAAFKCPPMPPELAKAAWRRGRLDFESGGNRMTRQWWWDHLIEHKVAVARAAAKEVGDGNAAG